MRPILENREVVNNTVATLTTKNVRSRYEIRCLVDVDHTAWNGAELSSDIMMTIHALSGDNRVASVIGSVTCHDNDMDTTRSIPGRCIIEARGSAAAIQAATQAATQAIDDEQRQIVPRDDVRAASGIFMSPLNPLSPLNSLNPSSNDRLDQEFDHELIDHDATAVSGYSVSGDAAVFCDPLPLPRARRAGTKPSRSSVALAPNRRNICHPLYTETLVAMIGVMQ
ncbi:MAG TPA: hypothetical protein VHN14_37505 [Kofleriaceae bacterium]|nr:hypothetical protein [Kofleriaceae bacterium]